MPDYAAEVPEAEAAEDTGLGDDETAGDEEADADGDDRPVEDGGDEGDAAAGEADGEGEGEREEPEAEAAREPAAEPAAEPEARADRRPGPKFVANSRPEAVALLEKVLAYYRVAEPTSPVPLLLDRAIDLSSKNFIELLGKVLPEGSLKVRQE